MTLLRPSPLADQTAEPLTKAEYIEQADAICRSYDEQLGPLRAEVQTQIRLRDFAAAADTVGEAVQITRTGVEELEAFRSHQATKLSWTNWRTFASKPSPCLPALRMRSGMKTWGEPTASSARTSRWMSGRTGSPPATASRTAAKPRTDPLMPQPPRDTAWAMSQENVETPCDDEPRARVRARPLIPCGVGGRLTWSPGPLPAAAIHLVDRSPQSAGAVHPSGGISMET